mmetsp:Transcript_32876/g.57434  ORF Transcript_32876/g.57434 Transcript_32876/m.57434 type:complete len:413 (+) Transcript_32876:6973-8211(+)
MTESCILVMAGLRVQHELEELEEGTELILDDVSVLDDEGGDKLMNARLKENYRASRIQAARKAQKPTHEYSAEEKKHTILPQYDDPLGDQELIGFTIGESGEFAAPVAVAHLGTGETLETRKEIAKEFSLPKKVKRNRLVVNPSKVSRTAMQDVYSQKRFASNVPKVIEEEEDEVAQSLSRTLLARREAEVVLKPSTPETEEGGVEFSDTLEFLQNVQAETRDLHQLATGALSVRDAVGGTTSVLNVALPSERIRFEAGVRTIAANTNSSTQDVKRRLMTGEGSQSEVKVEVPDVQFTEPVLGRGLAAVLGLIRERGYFNDKKHFGRQRDAKAEDEDFMEHVDDKGRVLTKNQAFRVQCYKFHNKNPGKKKLERLAVREHAKDIQALSGPSSFKAQKAIMSRVKAPYVVVPK